MTPVFCMHELEFFTLHLCGSTAHVFGNSTHLKSCDKVEPLRQSNPRQRSAPLLLLLEMNSLVTLSPNNEALHCLLHLPWKSEFGSLEQAQETNREDDCHRTAGMGSIKDQNLEFCVQEEETNLIIRRETHTQRLSESNRIQKHITNWSMGFLGTRVSMPISPPTHRINVPGMLNECQCSESTEAGLWKLENLRA